MAPAPSLDLTGFVPLSLRLTLHTRLSSSRHPHCVCPTRGPRQTLTSSPFSPDHVFLRIPSIDNVCFFMFFLVIPFSAVVQERSTSCNKVDDSREAVNAVRDRNYLIQHHHYNTTTTTVTIAGTISALPQEHHCSIITTKTLPLLLVQSPKHY